MENKNSVLINVIVLMIGLIILVNSALDFHHAYTTDSTLTDVANQNVNSISFWYIFGIIYGILCTYFLKGIVRYSAALVGTLSLLMTAYVALDSLKEGNIEPREAVLECMKKSTQEERSKCMEEMADRQLKPSE